MHSALGVIYIIYYEIVVNLNDIQLFHQTAKNNINLSLNRFVLLCCFKLILYMIKLNRDMQLKHFGNLNI